MTNNEKLETIEKTLKELAENIEYDLSNYGIWLYAKEMEIERIKYYEFVVNNMRILLSV